MPYKLPQTNVQDGVMIECYYDVTYLLDVFYK